MQQQLAQQPVLFPEGCMNLCQAAGLSLEYGEWHKACQLPDAASTLLHLCRDIQAAEWQQRELLHQQAGLAELT